METAARIVQDKLLPLKVIVKVVRNLAIGRALETNAGDKNKQTVVFVVCRLFLVTISRVPFNRIEYYLELIVCFITCTILRRKTVHTPR